MDRRRFLAHGLRAAAVPLVPGLALPAEGVTRARAAPAVRIDGLAPDGPWFDPQLAIDGGMTAAVVDMQMYPRTFGNAVAALALWNGAFRRPGARMVKATRAADIERASREGRLAVVLACQDAAILDTSTASVSDANLDNLGLFYDLGLRVLQLTHNEQNAVGGSFRERNDSGLSRLGEKVVAGMNALGMLIDLSHCGTRTTLDAIRLSGKPCAITHAGCRALYPTARNKTDEEIRAVAEKGGVFGVFNMSCWLTDAAVPTVDHVVDHLAYAVKLAGVEHVSFGSDGPVLALPSLEQELAGHRGYAERNRGMPGSERVPTHVRVPELNSPQRLERLAAALRRRGLGSDAVDKIAGGNLVRVLRDACG
jgi:membrane dipeptidase